MNSILKLLWSSKMDARWNNSSVRRSTLERLWCSRLGPRSSWTRWCSKKEATNTCNTQFIVLTIDSKMQKRIANLYLGGAAVV
jgi:hypothetical protein